MNLPNKLTILRIIMIPLFAICYYLTVIPYNFIVSAVIFALASLTDFLDGFIARKYNLVTDFGKFLDPIADKVLVSTALIVLIVPPTGFSAFGSYFTVASAVCVAIIIARELIVSGFRLVAAGKNLVIAADKSGKLKTFFTDVTILFVLVVMTFTNGALQIISFVLLVVTTLLTVYSGLECIIKNKDVLKDNQ